jgi:hypothetical protein
MFALLKEQHISIACDRKLNNNKQLSVHESKAEQHKMHDVEGAALNLHIG